MGGHGESYVQQREDCTRVRGEAKTWLGFGGRFTRDMYAMQGALEALRALGDKAYPASSAPYIV
jgi:hypothetical protein